MRLASPPRHSFAAIPALAALFLAAAAGAEAPLVRPEAVRAHVEFLASDALNGRGSGTRDELIAATYAASQLRLFGAEPAGDGGGYIQHVDLVQRELAGAPAIVVSPHSRPESRFAHGRAVIVAAMERGSTANVVARLPGSDPKRASEAVLLTAHIDHLGVGEPVDGDAIYNGANDDASGVAAVLELARALASGPRPKRTVLFALFGSEEQGGYGVGYFRERPPIPLDRIVAHIEFEEIGLPDPQVPPHTLWL